MKFNSFFMKSLVEFIIIEIKVNSQPINIHVLVAIYFRIYIFNVKWQPLVFIFVRFMFETWLSLNGVK